jgi:hypothetical protein
MGPAFMAMAVCIGAFGKPVPGTPVAIVWLACTLFFLAGVALSAQRAGRTGITRLVAPLIVLCLALVVTWVAFGPGERHCSSSIGFAGIASRSADSSCRGPFGIGAVLLWLLLAWGLWRTVRPASRDR